MPSSLNVLDTAAVLMRQSHSAWLHPAALVQTLSQQAQQAVVTNSILGLCKRAAA